MQRTFGKGVTLGKLSNLHNQIEKDRQGINDRKSIYFDEDEQQQQEEEENANEAQVKHEPGSRFYVDSNDEYNDGRFVDSKLNVLNNSRKPASRLMSARDLVVPFDTPGFH
jgi:hypothetical protein